jgi:hypothetical protein
MPDDLECPKCKKRNVAFLEKTTAECYDCGEEFEFKPAKLPVVKLESLITGKALSALSEYKTQFDAAELPERDIWLQSAFSYLRGMWENDKLTEQGYDKLRTHVNSWPSEPREHSYAFDLVLRAVARVNARDEKEARAQLDRVEAYNIDHSVVGTNVVLTEISLALDGEAEPPNLFELDGDRLE